MFSSSSSSSSSASATVRGLLHIEITGVTGLPNELVSLIVDYQKELKTIEKIQLHAEWHYARPAQYEYSWALPEIRIITQSLMKSTEEELEDAFFGLVDLANQKSISDIYSQVAREFIGACMVHFSTNPADCLQRMTTKQVFKYEPVIRDGEQTNAKRLQAVRTHIGVEQGIQSILKEN